MRDSRKSPHGGAPVRSPGLNLLLQDLVEHLCAGVVALDGEGEVVHLSDSLRTHFAPSATPPGSAAFGAEPLPIELLERIRGGVLGIEPGETRVFRLKWARRRRVRPKEYTAVASAAPEPTSPGGRLILVALQARVSPMRAFLSGARWVDAPRAAESIALEALVAECWAELSKTRAGASVELDVQIEPEVAGVSGDRRRWQELLREVGHAALETMPEGGALSIRARGRTAAAGRSVRLLVRDHGRGYDAPAIGRILRGEAAEAVEAAEHRLIAARLAAEALGGTMHLVSAQARGTSVVIDLPVVAGSSRRPLPRKRGRGTAESLPWGWA